VAWGSRFKKGRVVALYFGKRSRIARDSCDPDLQKVLDHAISKNQYDFTIIEGHRGEERQNYLYETKRSHVKWPDGMHNFDPSKAVDVAPLTGGKINWNDIQFFREFGWWFLLCSLEVGVDLRWGGDWDSDLITKDQNFHDLPHYELANR